MRNRILLSLGIAGLVLLVATEPAAAQRRVVGGGRVRVSAGRAYYGGRAYNRGYYGGYRGYNRPYYAGVNRPYYGGWGRGYGVGAYGYPLVGGAYPVAAGYALGSGYYGPNVISNLGPAYAANTTTTYQSFYSGPQGDPNTAQIVVIVPNPNAQVLFNGTLMQQKGTNRNFVTPPLSADKESHYRVTATWMENGQQVSRERRITVEPGARVEINFNEAGGEMPNVPD
jgi:uncharacterized protein (TIGR03000 family)